MTSKCHVGPNAQQGCFRPKIATKVTRFPIWRANRPRFSEGLPVEHLHAVLGTTGLSLHMGHFRLNQGDLTNGKFSQNSWHQTSARRLQSTGRHLRGTTKTFARPSCGVVQTHSRETQKG
jgi:hypothetical protein